jgi:hypothetical protein
MHKFEGPKQTWLQMSVLRGTYARIFASFIFRVAGGGAQNINLRLDCFISKQGRRGAHVVGVLWLLDARRGRK